MNKKLKYAAAAIAVLAAAIYLNNSNLLAGHHDGQPVLLAHRGMAQRFDERDLKNDTCTAARMLPPTHAMNWTACSSPCTSAACSACSMACSPPGRRSPPWGSTV